MCSFRVSGITWAHPPCSSLLASVALEAGPPTLGRGAPLPSRSGSFQTWRLSQATSEMVPDSQSYWLGDLSKLPKPSHLYILIRKRGTTAPPHLTMGKTEPRDGTDKEPGTQSATYTLTSTASSFSKHQPKAAGGLEPPAFSHQCHFLGRPKAVWTCRPSPKSPLQPRGHSGPLLFTCITGARAAATVAQAVAGEPLEHRKGASFGFSNAHFKRFFNQLKID